MLKMVGHLFKMVGKCPVTSIAISWPECLCYIYVVYVVREVMSFQGYNQLITIVNRLIMKSIEKVHITSLQMICTGCGT